jgi:glycosyltransferase involved in cell wall biosynthesis
MSEMNAVNDKVSAAEVRRLSREIEDRLKELSRLTGEECGTRQPELSVVIPFFNEEQNIPLLVEQLRKEISGMGINDYELIFVDDGSRDGTVSVLQSLMREDARIVLVELSRNFGHQVAVSAGLDHAAGKAVVVMDADLQDPPSVVPELVKKWREGYDVAYAVRQNRKENWFKCTAYKIFYRLLSRISSVAVPLDAGDFCCMDQRVVRILVAMPERTRFMRGLRSWVGLRQVGVPYDRDARYGGEPKYDFWRLVLLAMDGVVSLSHVPLRLVTTLGFIMSGFALLLGAFFTIKKMVIGLSPPGYASTMTAIFLLAGIQLVTIGVVGEYIGRIFDEVKGRPLYVLRRVTRAGRSK